MTGFYEDYDDTSGVHLSTAEQAAINAANSATAAATSATNAAASATSSGGASSAASTAAANAATSETNAASSATSASGSATAASTSANDAAVSESNAATSETNAATSATNASTSETNAAASASAASTSETNAATSETNAATSASTAATKASEASTSATNAATSETNAATSATNASNSASAASTSETNAASSATAASTSATNAATSATNAATSATNAATSETNASTSETNASNSATSAATAQTAAESARDAALAAFDSFDDRYLGPHSSDPTTDNDGDALAAGMLYFNTTTDDMKVYEGSSWVNAYASLSGALLATNNLSDLNNAGTARTNLGLGTAATTASTDYATAAQGTTADNALPKSGGAMTGAITTNSTFDGRDVSADGTKLDGIEAGATADQTAAEIKTAYESNADTNAFTDADHTKLDGIEASADVTDTANVTAAGALMDSELTSEASVKALNQGVATTDSPAFAGLTVDTDTLYVDSTFNRVGIGTSSVETKLHLKESGATSLFLKTQNSAGSLLVGNNSAGNSFVSAQTSGKPLILETENTERMRIAADGVITIPNTLQFDTSWNEPAIRFGSDAPFVRSDGNYVYWDGNGTSSLYYIYGFGGVVIDSKTTITNDDGLVVRSSTNGTGAPIEFSDHASGSYAQKGTLTYYHSDAASYGSGNAFVFDSSEASTSVVGNKAIFDNFLIKPSSGTGAGTLLVDSSRNITANYVKADRLYANDDGSTGYFYNDSGTRVAYTGGDFYIQSGVGNYYNYATNQYIGNSSGDTIYFRGNSLTHNGWNAEAAGHFRLYDNKYLKIGSGSDVEHFWNGSNYYTDINGGAVWYIRDGNSSNNSRFMMDVDNGNFHADGNIYAYSTSVSDEKLKKDITKVENALDKVSQLNGYEFTYLKDNKRSAGVIAQEVEKVLPQAVGEDELMHLEGDNEKYKYVEYDQLVALLIESIKELKAEVEELKGAK